MSAAHIMEHARFVTVYACLSNQSIIRTAVLPPRTVQELAIDFCARACAHALHHLTYYYYTLCTRLKICSRLLIELIRVPLRNRRVYPVYTRRLDMQKPHVVF